jgi:hypothetical protein
VVIVGGLSPWGEDLQETLLLRLKLPLRRQSLKPRLLTAEGTLDGAQRGPSAGARLERGPPKRTRDQHNRERRDNDKLPRRTIIQAILMTIDAERAFLPPDGIAKSRS